MTTRKRRGKSEFPQERARTKSVRGTGHLSACLWEARPGTGSAGTPALSPWPPHPGAERAVRRREGRRESQGHPATGGKGLAALLKPKTQGSRDNGEVGGTRHHGNNDAGPSISRAWTYGGSLVQLEDDRRPKMAADCSLVPPPCRREGPAHAQPEGHEPRGHVASSPPAPCSAPPPTPSLSPQGCAWWDRWAPGERPHSLVSQELAKAWIRASIGQRGA